MEAKTKAKPKTKKQLTDEKSKLNREIKSRKAELDVLNSKIGDIEKLADKKDALQEEVDELTQKKLELGKLTVQQQSVSSEVKDLNAEKKKLNTFIKNNKPKKETLESEVNDLEARKTDIEGKIETLMQNGKKAQANVAHLKEEKEKYESAISDLKNEYGLFPRDIKEMSRDSISQLKKYASLATLSVIGTLLMMGLLIFFLIQPIIDNTFAGVFTEPGLSFYTILSTKILLFAGLVFFIIVFLNLTRGLVSQYIKSRNRLTSLRVTDYLIDRAQASGSQNGKASADLLNEFLPRIMELDSSFDKALKSDRK